MPSGGPYSRLTPGDPPLFADPHAVFRSLLPVATVDPIDRDPGVFMLLVAAKP